MRELIPDRITTDRVRYELIHRNRTDVQELYEVCANPGRGVTEHTNWTPHETPHETLSYIHRSTERLQNDRGMRYVMRQNDRIIGVSGATIDWNLRRAETGIWLRRSAWGQNISGERIDAFLRLFFDALDLTVHIVTHTVENRRSKQAIEKYIERHGGRCIGVIPNEKCVDGQPTDERMYTIKASDWSKNNERTDVMEFTVASG